MNYYSNWQFGLQNGQVPQMKNSTNTRMQDDSCFIDQQNADYSKKIKYYTTNHSDLLQAQDNMNFFGIDISDTLFVPSDKIDIDSSLRNGSKMTNFKTKNEGFGQLPFPTMPARFQMSQNVEKIDVESSFRSNDIQTFRKKTCLPKDYEYYNRSFYIFNDEIEKPNAVNSVELPEKGWTFQRSGISTRFLDRNFDGKRT